MRLTSAVLVETRPRTTILFGGRRLSGPNPPARIVSYSSYLILAFAFFVFLPLTYIETVGIYALKELGGDPTIPTASEPFLRVPPAKVNTSIHVLGTTPNAIIDKSNVPIEASVRIYAKVFHGAEK